MVVNELITAFGFRGNINPLKDFNKEAAKSIRNSTKWAVGLAGLGALFSKIIVGSLKSNNALVQFAHLTDESVSSIQGLELAGAKFGSSLGDGVKSIQNLSKALADARVNGNETFGKLGISVFDANNQLKSSTDVLSDINELFNSQNEIYGKGADKRLKLQALQSLGISEGLLPLLMRETDEYEKQIAVAKQLALSKDQSDGIREFNNVLSETTQTAGLLIDQITAEFAPAFTSILKLIKEFVVNNKELVITTGKWLVTIGLMAGAYSAVHLAVKAVWVTLKLVKVTMVGIRAVMVSIRAISVASLALNTALVSAVLLKKAMIGIRAVMVGIRAVMIGISIASLPITGTFLLIAAAVVAIGAGIYYFRDELAKAWGWVKGIGDVFASWGWEKIKGIGEWFANLFSGIQTWWDELDFSISAPSWLSGWFGGGDEKSTESTGTRATGSGQKAKPSLRDYYKMQKLSPSADLGGTRAEYNTTQENNITVHTNDAKVMQEVIENSINREIETIIETTTGGGL